MGQNRAAVEEADVVEEAVPGEGRTVQLRVALAQLAQDPRALVLLQMGAELLGAVVVRLPLIQVLVRVDVQIDPVHEDNQPN